MACGNKPPAFSIMVYVGSLHSTFPPTCQVAVVRVDFSEGDLPWLLLIAQYCGGDQGRRGRGVCHLMRSVCGSSVGRAEAKS